MNKIVAPDQFSAADDDGKDWTYGAQVEAPLRPDEGAAGTVQEARPADQPPSVGQTGSDAPAARAREGDPKKDGREERPAETEREEAPPPPPSIWVFLIVGLILAGLLAWGIFAHLRQNGSAADTQTQTESAVPQVRTTDAKKEDGPTMLTLPGQTEAFYTANIYPRATGYVAVRRVDIGSRVKKGDLLIHIAAPDVDQQLQQAVAQLGQVDAAEAQAQAQVSQAEANLNLAKVTLARTASLTQQGYETVQNKDNQTANQSSQQASVDTAKAGVNVAAANTKAQQATVDRLKALASFEDVVAPFDGVVTARNVDLGDLVNADSGSSTPLFSMSKDDVIRVAVQVPQNSAIGVGDGLDASVEVPQMPGQFFTGKVTRSSVALISSARTLTTEVDIPNRDGKLRAGLYVYVTIAIPRTHADVMVPAEALIFNDKGLQVAVVDGDKVAMHQVKVYRDFGTTVELSEGLQGGEQIILSPPATLANGAKVKAVKADADKNSQTQNGQSGAQGQGGDNGEKGQAEEQHKG